MHFHYRVTFTGYIRCFCATTPHDLVTLTFDLLTLRVSHVQCFSCPTHIPIFIILRLSVTELRVLNIWSHYHHLHGMVTAHKPCYMRKIAFIPLSRLQNSMCMRSITWPVDLCIGGPPKPHVTIFCPRLIYSLYNFYGATMTIKGSFVLEHPHVKAIFGRKKTVQSKSVPEMAVFRKFKGMNIKYSYRDPQKALSYPERHLFTYFA